MPAEYTVGWLSLNSASTVHVKLSQVDEPVNSEVTDDGSGTIYAEHLSLTAQRPEANGTTGAIGTMISQIGLNGQCVGSGKTITSADVIFRKLGTCDVPLGATPHLRHRYSKGLIVLQSISASRNQDASLAFRLKALSDAGGAPVAITDGVAQPGTPVEERYRLAICKFGNIQFPEIESVSLSYNIELTQDDPALTGVIWPSDVGVLVVRPVFTIQGKDLSRVKTSLIELTGNGATHANTTFQLARLQDSASYYSFAASQHIEMTVGGLVVPDNLGSASARSRATNTLTLTTAFDGTNAPIVATIGTDISATP